MAYKTQEILALIQEFPGIMQCEIAKKADCELDTIAFALKSEIQVGNVISLPSTDSNGKIQYAYFPKPVDDAPTKSKVQLAMACIKEHKFAEDATLRRVMGLKDGAQVAPYLAFSVKNRYVIRMRKDGMLGYSLGDKYPAIDIPKQRAALGLDHQEAVPEVKCAADFTCAIWSHDKSMQIQRGNLCVATLSKEEVATMYEYLKDFFTKD